MRAAGRPHARAVRGTRARDHVAAVVGQGRRDDLWPRRDAGGGRGGLTPASVRALDAVALRGAGVSRPKIGYLYDLADHVGDGRLDLHALDGHPDEEVVTRITAVKGLGRWSAEMFLMFRLNRPDILPVDDLGIVKGMQKLFGMKRRPKPTDDGKAG